MTIIQISIKYNFRTQSSIVQVIRIVPKEGTIERNHKSITKVTLSVDYFYRPQIGTIGTIR